MYVQVKNEHTLYLLNGYIHALDKSITPFELNKKYKVIDKKHFPIMNDILSDKTYLYELEEYDFEVVERAFYIILMQEKPILRIGRINFSSTMFNKIKENDNNC